MHRYQCLLASFLISILLPFASAQDARNTTPSGRQVRALAVEGQPFGVLSFQIPIPDELAEQHAKQASDLENPIRVLVTDAENRTFFPVVTVETVTVQTTPQPNAESGRGLRGRGRLGGRIINRIREAIRDDADEKSIPVAINVETLFKGSDPIQLQLQGDLEQKLVVTPRQEEPSTRNDLIRKWWNRYTQDAQRTINNYDFPKLVHKYLLAMLSDRLGLPKANWDSDRQVEEGSAGELEQPLKTLSLLSAIEPLREEILEKVLNQPPEAGSAELPVPSEPQWQTPELPALEGPAAVEAIASRIPPECFYLRFGAFRNFVWMQDIAQNYGGDFAQAIMLRGYNYDASARMERMLATKMTQLAKMFGDNLISDMALFGTDLYLKEGASLGVVFQAKNAALLSAAIRSDRQAVAQRTPDAQLSELKLSGKKVLRLSTPDNRIRSFFVVDGEYVLVTTSEYLVQRFLDVADGQSSLADTAHFKWARSWMLLENEYSIFAYFSPQFFQNLVSPQYQIELHRRLEAIAHLEIAELASQMAIAEGVDANQIPEMIDAGLLPAWFDQRPDAAQTLRSGGTWIDSMRGARGSFLPIADVNVQAVTTRELETYNRLSEYYQREWRQMDPMVIGVRRFQDETHADAELVAFEAYVAPFQAEKYGWLGRLLGTPTPVSIQLPTNDIASVQVRMRGDTIINTGSGDYHLFAGIKDMVPPDFEQSKGLLKTLQALRSMPAYLGAWPKPGLVELIPIIGRNLAVADVEGYTRVIGGLWRWQDASLSLLSFDRSILEDAIPQIEIQETDDYAQARAQVDNLEETQISGWVNQQWYQRGWKSSHANTILLDTVLQQLKVPAEECLATTERLLDVRLQCPLGGDYELTDLESSDPSQLTGGQLSGWWTSSAWTDVQFDPNTMRPLAPESYRAAWIEWFRGGKVHLTQGTNSLSLVGEISLDMEAPSVNAEGGDPAILPQMNFDLFGLPSKIFGGSEDKNSPKRRRF